MSVELAAREGKVYDLPSSYSIRYYFAGFSSTNYNYPGGVTGTSSNDELKERLVALKNIDLAKSNHEQILVRKQNRQSHIICFYLSLRVCSSE